MSQLLTKSMVAVAAIVTGLVVILVGLAGPINKREKNTDQLAAYLDVVPAETLKGLQTIHGGSSNGPHEYHLATTIFDGRKATRISDATVTAKVLGLGVIGQETKLEPMNAANGTIYGGFIHLPGIDVYTIELTVERSGFQQPVILDFSYDHRSQ